MEHKIGYKRALELVLSHIPEMGLEDRPLEKATGGVLGEDVTARVDSPSLDASLKEGYAVHSADVAGAERDRPVKLTLHGLRVAGDEPGFPLPEGAVVRVTTGAPIPPGADAVLAGEYAREEQGRVLCFRDAGPGRNVLPRGTDVHQGQLIARKGDRLHPAGIGLMAAAGLNRVRVYRRPGVAVIGTGDEVVAPGRPLSQGKLYASNIMETVSWLRRFGLREVATHVIPDRLEALEEFLAALSRRSDAVITSGGAWGSERDLVIQALERLGWSGIFHRVRLGPGKAAGFGLLDGRPVFVLPGGPPSHEAAFLLLALPGVLAMSGRRDPPFPMFPARLTGEVGGQADWTQVVHGRLERSGSEWRVRILKSASRLSSMAEKDVLFTIPEGVEVLHSGDWVETHLLNLEDCFFTGE